MKKLFILLFPFIFFSCSKVQKEPLVLDQSNPHSLSSDISWLVITEPYVGVKEEADWTAAVTFHAKKGEVFEIKGKVYGDKRKVWYIVENGYVEDKSAAVFDNQYRAKVYAKSITDIN